jgi:hypothetical protein
VSSGYGALFYSRWNSNGAEHESRAGVVEHFESQQPGRGARFLQLGSRWKSQPPSVHNALVVWWHSQSSPLTCGDNMVWASVTRSGGLVGE